jgi:hypothetical protein
VSGSLQRYLYNHYKDYGFYIPGYFWPLLFMPVFGALALLMIYTAFQYMKPYSRVCLLIGLALLVSAVGLDAMEGFFKHHSFGFDKTLTENQIHVFQVIEETIESGAFGFILSSFLQYFADTFQSWRIDLK